MDPAKAVQEPVLDSMAATGCWRPESPVETTSPYRQTNWPWMASNRGAAIPATPTTVATTMATDSVPAVVTRTATITTVVAATTYCHYTSHCLTGRHSQQWTTNYSRS